MSVHNLKIHRQPFDDLVSGLKTCEVRNCSDRDFKVGDSVELFMTETDSGLASESIVRTITHIQRGYGLPDDICVLSYGAVLAQEAGPVAWTSTKPTVSGAYWVRGNGLVRDALIQAIEEEGELRCNLHIRTTEDDFGYGYSIDQLSDKFEWLGPLFASPPAPVAVVMSFDFEHQLSKERRTVSLTKRDVYDGMEDYLYDKLGEQICQCESVGETNVVDCNCDEYVHDFEIVESCIDKVEELNQ